MANRTGLTDITVDIDHEALAEFYTEVRTDQGGDLAQEILDDAKAHAPVRSGRLRNSGHLERDGEDWDIVFDTPYAADVEFGTTRQQAQPFLRSAAYRQRDQ